MQRWIRLVLLVVLVRPISAFAGCHPHSSDYAMISAASHLQVPETSSGRDDSASTARGSPAVVVSNEAVLSRTRQLIERIRSTSFPELEGARIQVEVLQSDADFFRTRFGLPQFFLRRKMLYLVKVNPHILEFEVPEEGLEAIVAHELSHLVYYARGNRVRLLALTRLLSENFTARFERWTDLQAISRGYGQGLKLYREWLYHHLSQNKIDEKRRHYFSPAEIDAILLRIQTRPELLRYWLKNIPGNLREIEKSSL